MSGLNAYELALIKRRSQYSNVIVFKTLDMKRLDPWINILDKFYQALKSRRKIKDYIIYIFKVGKGLYEVKVLPTGIHYKPVTMTSGIPMPGLGAQRIVDLNLALTYITQQMDSAASEQLPIAIATIFWGLFERNTKFIEFLRGSIFDYNYYKAGHIITVFTEVPEVLIDDETLRYSIVVEIPPSTDDERRELIKSLVDQMGKEGLRIQINGSLESLVMSTKGLNLTETEAVILESVYKHKRLDPRVITSYKYDIVRKSGVLDIEEPQKGFEAVGGYDILKEFIKLNVIKVLRNPKLAERLGLRPPRGLLFFGPPGTGKTWFAKALAKELGIPFLRLRTEKIWSKYVGETERNIAKAIEIAEAVAPCVMFIDEVDRFGRRTSIDTDSGTTRRAFSIFLEWLGDDRRKTIVIATTNVPEYLDEAFIRVGRFDYIIPFLYPDYQARLQILQVHTSVVRKVPLKNVDLKEIAKNTELWSGAELEELVIRAARNALKEDREYVTHDDFVKALESFSINVEQRKQQLEHYMRLAYQFCNDRQFLKQLNEAYGKMISTTTKVDAFLEELK